MLPKARLTLHSRISEYRWVMTSSWLSGSLRPFLYSSVYSCHFFLIFSALVRSLLFLSFIVPTFVWNVSLLGISNFLKEISSLSHSIVFFYLFALVTEEDFLISPCYSLEFCIQWVYLRGNGHQMGSSGKVAEERAPSPSFNKNSHYLGLGASI